VTHIDERVIVSVDQPVKGRCFAATFEIVGLERARRHVANLAHGLKTPLGRFGWHTAERDYAEAVTRPINTEVLDSSSEHMFAANVVCIELL